jgi:hypothetical protein
MPWDSVDKWRDEDYDSVDSAVTSDAERLSVRPLTETQMTVWECIAEAERDRA